MKTGFDYLISSFQLPLLPFTSALTSPAALTTLGVLFLLFVAYDVYTTILDARGRAGPISEALNRSVWFVWRTLANRLSRTRRHRFLDVIGPLLLPALIIVYLVLLITGFALIYYPRMPAHFIITAEAVSDRWADALYFSGVTLTTVGYGDIAPRTAQMRFVAITEGAAGFALISLAVTYLLSVYGALERKRAVALSFYHQAEGGANVASFIAHHYVAGRFYGLDGVLRNATRDLHELLESHVEHPIIHYFHPTEVYKGLPRVLFLTLETCAVIHACLDEEEYPETCRHPEVQTLRASARHVLGELVVSLDLEREARRRKERPFEESKRWERRFQQTLRLLRRAGIVTKKDLAIGWEEYRSEREEWESHLYRFAVHLGYDWDEVTGDGDLSYAADEEMEEPHGNV